MTTYPGLPAPIVCDWLGREAAKANHNGAPFQIGKIEMVGKTGTYIDSPFHRYENGKDISELPLESVANLDCIVVRVDPAAGPAIDNIPIAAHEVAGKAVLFHCGLEAVPDAGSRFYAVPVKVKAIGTFPVRAFVADAR